MQVSDANTTITELREEIDQLRARLKDTAQQLAEAHAQLGADRNSSSELAAIIKQLELELEQLKVLNAARCLSCLSYLTVAASIRASPG